MNVLDTLKQAGLVEAEAPETDTLESPWFVKVLLGFSGWLASLFLLGFLAIGFQFIFESTASMVTMGGIMIAAAFFLLRLDKNEFFEHVGLAVSLAGQVVLIIAIFDSHSIERTMGWYLAALLQVLLAVVMPNFIHRVFSSFFAAFCFAIAFESTGILYLSDSIIMLAAAMLWLHEFDCPKHMRKVRAMGYGLVLALIQVKGSALFQAGSLFGHKNEANLALWFQPWMGDVLAGFISLYVVWKLLQRLDHNLAQPISIAALLGTTILVAASVEAPGITIGMLIMLLGFAGSNRVLMGLGIASLLFYISSYYYLLDATLLEKSQTLLIVGLLLLAARWLLLRVMVKHTGAQHE